MYLNGLNNIVIRQYGARNRNLKKLGFNSYEEYLLSDKWKQLRDYAESKGFLKKCSVCGATKDLILHHRKYVYLLKPLKKQIRHLKTLCRSCHEEVHKMTERGKRYGLSTSVRRLRKLKLKDQQPLF